MADQPKKILVVEDEQSLLQVLADKFESEGFKVFTAADGQQALDIVFAEWPDMILLDLMMPNVDGMTVIKKLRADEKAKQIPVIVLTNLSDSERVYEAVHNNAYDYLVKADWSIEDVVNKVKERLAKAA